MTEESKVMEFGSHVGQVIKFFNRKGFGFIHDLNDEKDYFIHNSDIACEEGIYRKLYPGEYVSYNIGKQKDGRDKCVEVRGIMGNLLLTENEDNNYRVYQKKDIQVHGITDPADESLNNHVNDDSDGSDDSINDEPKEVINKEAPEGIEVAEFDGLNTNEEMR